MKHLVSGSLLVLMVFVTPAQAADVLIRITGNIKVNTCELSAASQDLSVAMKTAVLGKARYQEGETFEPTPFSINISKCNSATAAAHVTFSGVAEAHDSSILSLSQGGASGLGIQLRDAHGEVVALNTPSSRYALQPDITNTLEFSARYITTAAVLTPGQANAVADFAIEYE